MGERACRSVRGRASIATDVGTIGDRATTSRRADPGGRYYVVADGVGGLPAGGVASAMAVEVVRKRLDAARAELAALATTTQAARRDRVDEIVVSAVHDAHRAVYERARREPDKYGMSTTLDLVVLAGGEAVVAHVGDGRVYAIRDGAACQLTSDHNVRELMMASGSRSPTEARQMPGADLLLNAIGMNAELTIDLLHRELRAGDVVLLATDDLYDCLPDDELAGRLSSRRPAAALRDLVDRGRARVGRDDMTGIIVEIVDEPLGAPQRRPASPLPPPASPASRSIALGALRRAVPLPPDRSPPRHVASASASSDAAFVTLTDEVLDDDPVDP